MKALIIIDVQNEYSMNGAITLNRYYEVVNKTVEHAKNNSYDKIILVAHEDLKYFVKGTKGREIDDRIKELSDIVVVKKHADSFQDTNLEELLPKDTELFITGMMTQNCVIFTALTGKELGYKVNILEKLCTTRDDFVQEAAIRALRSKDITIIRN